MKLTHAILGLALVGLLSFSIANYTKLANMIDKNTNTWEERYNNALVKLEEKAKNYDRQIFELQVQVKKRRIPKHRTSQEAQKIRTHHQRPPRQIARSKRQW